MIDLEWILNLFFIFTFIINRRKQVIKVINVNPLSNYKLSVAFDDGVSGIIDLKDFVENGIFSVLKDKDSFDKVYNSGYSIAWSDELEIDPLTVYAELLGKQPEEILTTNLKYATN